MLHYLNSDSLNSLQKFFLLFGSKNNFGLKKIDMQANLRSLHLFNSNYQGGIGGGINDIKLKAALKSMGEAVERYSFKQAKPDFFDFSFYDLIQKKIPCLDPESYKIYHESQIAFKKKEVYNVNRKSKVNWSWFEDVAGKKILLPANFNQNLNRRVPHYFMPSTSGKSCANNAVEAKLRALLEFVERDAFIFYWCTKNQPKKIDISKVESELEKKLAPLGDILKKTTLFYLETDIKSVTTVLACYRGDGITEPFFSVTGASHLSPDEAIIKALHEQTHCIQYFGMFHKNSKKRYKENYDEILWDFPDHWMLYATTPLEKAYKFLFSKKQKVIKYADIPNNDLGESGNNLKLIIKDFSIQRHRLYFKNNTPKNVKRAGLFVYRAFSPDLISMWPMHRYRKYGYNRYYNLAKKLKLQKCPQTVTELNPFPHPYP